MECGLLPGPAPQGDFDDVPPVQPVAARQRREAVLQMQDPAHQTDFTAPEAKVRDPGTEASRR